jgi:hypothetical protein
MSKKVQGLKLDLIKMAKELKQERDNNHLKAEEVLKVKEELLREKAAQTSLRTQTDDARKLRNELFEKDSIIRQLTRKVSDLELEKEIIEKNQTSDHEKVKEMEQVMNTCKGQISSYDQLNQMSQ